MPRLGGERCGEVTRYSQFMAKSRQPFLVRSLAAGYMTGVELDEHTHSWHQLLFAARGAMTLRVRQADQLGDYVVPSTRSAWIPAGTSHQVRMDEPVQMRTLYFPPESGLSRCVGTLDVSALLR